MHSQYCGGGWWLGDTRRHVMSCHGFASDISENILVSAPEGVKLALWWRHNGHDGISNHQPHDFLLNRLFRCGSKKTSKLHVTGLCAGNSPGTGEFPAHMASNAKKMFPFHDVIMCPSRCYNYYSARYAQDFHMWSALWCGLLLADFTHIHQGCNHMIAPMTVKQPWRILVNGSHKSTIMNWYDLSETNHNKIMYVLWDNL